MSRKENAELRKQWEVRISQYRASNETQVRWCDNQNISIHQFKYWLKKIENNTLRSSNSTQWMSVSLEESFNEMTDNLHVTVAGATIVVSPGFNPTLLADVVKTLRALC